MHIPWILMDLKWRERMGTVSPRLLVPMSPFATEDFAVEGRRDMPALA